MYAWLIENNHIFCKLSIMSSSTVEKPKISNAKIQFDLRGKDLT